MTILSLSFRILCENEQRKSPGRHRGSIAKPFWNLPSSSLPLAPLPSQQRHSPLWALVPLVCGTPAPPVCPPHPTLDALSHITSAPAVHGPFPALPSGPGGPCRSGPGPPLPQPPHSARRLMAPLTSSVNIAPFSADAPGSYLDHPPLTARWINIPNYLSNSTVSGKQGVRQPVREEPRGRGVSGTGLAGGRGPQSLQATLAVPDAAAHTLLGAAGPAPPSPSPGASFTGPERQSHAWFNSSLYIVSP